MVVRTATWYVWVASAAITMVMPKMMQKSYAIVHQAKWGNFSRMSAMSDATKAINQASCNPGRQSVCVSSICCCEMTKTYVCNRYCRKRKRISDDVTCPVVQSMCLSLHAPTGIPKLKRLIAPLPIPRRLRPLPSMLPFILRRDGERRLPYDGMGSQATKVVVVEPPA